MLSNYLFMYKDYVQPQLAQYIYILEYTNYIIMYNVQGLSPTPACTIIFILVYFSSLSAAVWWTITTATWTIVVFSSLDVKVIKVVFPTLYGKVIKVLFLSLDYKVILKVVFLLITSCLGNNQGCLLITRCQSNLGCLLLTRFQGNNQGHLFSHHLLSR